MHQREDLATEGAVNIISFLMFCETNLAGADQSVGDVAIQRFWEVVNLSDDLIDEVGLCTQPLEEQIGLGSLVVRFQVHLRQVGL